LKIYTFAGYNTDYIIIYFQIFLKFRNKIFDYFYKKGLLELMCTKSLPGFSPVSSQERKDCSDPLHSLTAPPERKEFLFIYMELLKLSFARSGDFGRVESFQIASKSIIHRSGGHATLFFKGAAIFPEI
jgi:hypothetical protein